MLRKVSNVLAYPFPKLCFRRLNSSEPDRFRVTVVGSAGGIGQPLSLLLRLHPLVSTLKLFDLKGAQGVAADLAHIDRPGLTKGFDGKDDLIKALRCTDIIVVAAGVPRKPGQSRDDLFDANACIMAEIADAVGTAAPEAFLAIITNPINSMVPVAAEILKKHDVYNPFRIAGITTLDVVRAKKFIADCICVDPRRVKVPVIGGHSGNTIVPLISQTEPNFTGDEADIQRITKRIQNAGTEVVDAKGGNGSATLSMAYAAANFVNSLLIAKSERKEVRDIAFVESCVTPAKFFASEIRIGYNGILDTMPLPDFSPYEELLLCEAMPQLIEDIKKGCEFGQGYAIAEKKDDCEDEPPPRREEPKNENNKNGRCSTSRSGQKSDSGDKKKSMCEDLIRQMKNNPCRKGSAKNNESKQSSKESPDSPCGSNYNPCQDFSNTNDGNNPNN